MPANRTERRRKPALLRASAPCLALWLCIPLAAASGAGRTFFNEKVVPKLVENGCPACHIPGYVRPRVMEYEEALPFLAMGDTAKNSVLLYKIANLRSIAPDRPTHVGGQRCASLDAEPCRTILEWWGVEFGNASGAAPATTSTPAQEVERAERSMNAAYASNDFKAYLAFLADDFMQYTGDGRTDLATYRRGSIGRIKPLPDRSQPCHPLPSGRLEGDGPANRPCRPPPAGVA